MGQYEYYKSDTTGKQQLINGMNPLRTRLIAMHFIFGIYSLLSIIVLVYPVVWFGFAWRYLDIILVANGADYVFYWFIGVSYTTVFVCCGIAVASSMDKSTWTRIST